MSAALLEIGAVARELGIAPSTLRSWERRYRLVVPLRGPNGQRLYDSEQVVILRQILAQVHRGVRAGAAHHAMDAPVQLAARRFRLDPGPEAPLAARRQVDQLLGARQSDEDFAFNLRLVASELVKNAVLYGQSSEPIEVDLAALPRVGRPEGSKRRAPAADEEPAHAPRGRRPRARDRRCARERVVDRLGPARDDRERPARARAIGGLVH